MSENETPKPTDTTKEEVQAAKEKSHKAWDDASAAIDEADKLGETEESPTITGEKPETE